MGFFVCGMMGRFGYGYRHPISANISKGNRLVDKNIVALEKLIDLADSDPLIGYEIVKYIFPATGLVNILYPEVPVISTLVTIGGGKSGVLDE